jgi:ubiquitin
MEEEKNFLNFFKTLELSEPEPVPKKSKVKKKPAEKSVAPYQIHTVQDYSMDIHKQRDAMFIRRLQETGRVSAPNKLPAMVDVLNYIAQIPNQPLWFKASQHAIINSKSLKFPTMDVLTRAFIMKHMRTPMGNELPCQNNICESERLGGFRIRILDIKDNYWCYLCHLSYTNHLYVESLNRKQDTDRVYQIHYFMVQVDVPGEYRLDKTLIGEKDVRGLFGPFPVYNVNNYTQIVTSEGCKGWQESDCMVFRLPQTVPSQTELCTTTQLETESICNPSNRTKSRSQN